MVSKVNLHNPNWLNSDENKWIVEKYENNEPVTLIMQQDIIPAFVKEI